jgi:multicomponent Na+:H+ antiporter subunit B
MSDFELINVILLLMITFVAIAVVRLRNLVAVGMLMSIYSLLMALIWTNMDSMDVAFTEAAVGAGISTVLFIGALVHVGTEEKPNHAIHWPALLVTGATAAALLYGTVGMPRFGEAASPANANRVAAGYIRQDVEKTADPWGHHEPAHAEEAAGEQHEASDYFHGHVPNYVTSVIVSYRGFDTMFETTVIFIAGLSLVLFLRRRSVKP